MLRVNLHGTAEPVSKLPAAKEGHFRSSTFPEPLPSACSHSWTGPGTGSDPTGLIPLTNMEIFPLFLVLQSTEADPWLVRGASGEYRLSTAHLGELRWSSSNELNRVMRSHPVRWKGQQGTGE